MKLFHPWLRRTDEDVTAADLRKADAYCADISQEKLFRLLKKARGNAIASVMVERLIGDEKRAAIALSGGFGAAAAAYNICDIKTLIAVMLSAPVPVSAKEAAQYTQTKDEAILNQLKAIVDNTTGESTGRRGLALLAMINTSWDFVCSKMDPRIVGKLLAGYDVTMAAAMQLSERREAEALTVIAEDSSVDVYTRCCAVFALGSVPHTVASSGIGHLCEEIQYVTNNFQVKAAARCAEGAFIHGDINFGGMRIGSRDPEYARKEAAKRAKRFKERFADDL